MTSHALVIYQACVKRTHELVYLQNEEVMDVSYSKAGKAHIILKSNERVNAQGEIPGMHIEGDIQPSIEKRPRVFQLRNCITQVPTGSRSYRYGGPIVAESLGYEGPQLWSLSYRFRVGQGDIGSNWV